MKNILPFLLILGLLFQFSCSSEQSEGVEESEDYSSLPPAAGGVGEVLLVMDTNHLHNEIGKALEDVLLKPYPGLPQAETNYKMNRIHFPAFGSLFKKAKTVIFAVPFDLGVSAGYIENTIGKEATKKIKETGKSIMVKKDVFAKDQQIIFIFGSKEEDMAANIRKEEQSIFALIDQKERERLEAKLYKVGEKKELAKQLREDLGFNLRVPADYSLVMGTKNCTWLRLAKETTDYNILISTRPYTSESQFDSAYIADWREELSMNVDAGDTSSTKIVQDIFPFDTRVFANPYKVEDRGLWKLKNNIMGGPFVSEVKLGASGENIYYIEGFVAAPGESKRELVRELETIMATFEGA